VAILEFLVIEIEGVGGSLAGVAVPAVGEDDAADIPEECGDVRRDCSVLNLDVGGAKRILLQVGNGRRMKAG